MISIEDRVHNELGRLVEGYVPTLELPGRIKARTRQRATNLRRATVGAMALLVVAAGAVTLSSRGQGGNTVASGSLVAPGTAGASVGSPQRTGPATAVVPAVAAPPSFLAGIGAGHEQATVVDTASGRMVRALSAAPPGQMLWQISPDGRTLYAPSQQTGGCSWSYQAIDIASGVSQGPAFADVTNLAAVAPSPDGRTLAYTTGCAPAAAGDVYLRRPNGSTTSLPTGGRGVQLSWNHDGTMLAFDFFDAHNGAGVLQVWSIEPSSVTGPYLIPAPDPGCSLSLPRFARDGLFAVERCPSTTTSSAAPVTIRLVLLDPTTGTKERSWPLATAPYALVADLTVDPTGGWALYSLGTNTINGQASLLDLGPATASPRVLLNDTFEVAWLPTTAAP